MSVKILTRDEMASWYAQRHLATDPGIRAVYYLPNHAPANEIRFVEVNELMAVRENDPLEPIDFGVDVGGGAPHRLVVLDVTPSQWGLIAAGARSLPQDWLLAGAISFERPTNE